MAPPLVGVSVRVPASPLTSSVGGLVSSTATGNCPVLWLPAASDAVHVAVHEPSGMNVDVPSTGKPTEPDASVRTHETVAAPESSVAVTEIVTVAPPGALPSSDAR